jgi:hypothetical protein
MSGTALKSKRHRARLHAQATVDKPNSTARTYCCRHGHWWRPFVMWSGRVFEACLTCGRIR